MALVPKKTKRIPDGAVLVLLCLLSIALMTVWVREGDSGILHDVRAVFGTVMAPFQQVGSLASSPIREVGNYSENAGMNANDIMELKAENEELRASAIRLEEYRQESERLQKLLELKDVYNLEAVGARVIGWSTDSWNRVITINKGSSANLTAGMPVMNANGLIGQTESVSLNSSTVRLITDERSGVAVFLQESRTEGVLTGSYDGLLYLQFIPLDIKVDIGNSIITSGAGGVYPKGIPVGEVVAVELYPNDVYQTIVVKPVTRVANYEEVLVLTGHESEIAPNYNAVPQTGNTGTEDGADGADTDTGAGEDGDTSQSMRLGRYGVLGGRWTAPWEIREPTYFS
ncbi:MAG: rod shape-determining protein MreC [Coriobacteriales bacterium]|jgi:rod shape-determining protein MreC|nr:rod shape-determining protein MreC [Coriobacteriales bacterium]